MHQLSHWGRGRGFSILLLAAALLTAAGACAADARPGKQGHAAKTDVKAARVGLASYYGKRFDGRKTASGEIFDKTEMVAAHPSYPVGTRARVTNLRNGRSAEVRIIDRGPTREHQYEGVIIDVSEAAARTLGFRHKGRTRVRVEVLEWGERKEQARLGSLH